MLNYTNFPLGILALFVFSGLNAQTKNAQKVLATEARRFEAMTHADTSALQSMLASDLVYVHSNSLIENKQEHLAAIGSRKLVYEMLECEEASVRFYGNTALVNGKVKVRGTLNGNAFQAKLFGTAVYRKKRCAWVLVNWQSTRVP